MQQHAWALAAALHGGLHLAPAGQGSRLALQQQLKRRQLAWAEATALHRWEVLPPKADAMALAKAELQARLAWVMAHAIPPAQPVFPW